MCLKTFDRRGALVQRRARMKSNGKLERALIARIKRGDDIASIRKWFFQELEETDFKLGDLTPFEEAFFNQTVEAYMAWEREQRERKLN